LHGNAEMQGAAQRIPKGGKEREKAAKHLNKRGEFDYCTTPSAWLV